MDYQGILRVVERILERRGIKHYLDPRIKRFSGNKPYVGIYAHKRKLFFTDFIEEDYIQAIVPNNYTPEEIEQAYGIEGYRDSIGDKYGSKTHYVFNIPIAGKMINNQRSVQSVAGFFVDMALSR